VIHLLFLFSGNEERFIQMILAFSIKPIRAAALQKYLREWKYYEEKGVDDIFSDMYEELDIGEKLVLYSIGALGNSPIRSKTKLQKLLFLFSNVFEKFKEPLDFEAHLFGPYSESIDYILEDLTKLDLVEKRGSYYRLSSRGIDIYNKIRIKEIKEHMKTVMEDFKGFLNDLTQEELLAFVYVTYPEYIEEAAKWDEIKEKRKEIAISLLRKNKISFGKAAEISGFNQEEFQKILKRRLVRWREI
jgi:predicted HTH domain antitoxin